MTSGLAGKAKRDTGLKWLIATVPRSAQAPANRIMRTVSGVPEVLGSGRDAGICGFTSDPRPASARHTPC
jgi:hypothetical protein